MSLSMLGHRWVIPLLTLLLGGALGVALFWGWQQAQEPSAAIPSPSAKPAGRTILYYRNPMGLPDISATPKKDEMGMPYLPVYADEAGNTPSGSATITVSPDRIQALGVTTEPVRRERLQRTLRAVGQLVVDERRTVMVAPKFGGWIERLPVNTTGQTVHAGEYHRANGSCRRDLAGGLQPGADCSPAGVSVGARVAEPAAPGAIPGWWETHQPE